MSSPRERVRALRKFAENLFGKLKLRWITAVAVLAIYLPVLGGILWPMIWYLMMISPALYHLLYWWWTPLTNVFPNSMFFLSGYVQVGVWAESPLHSIALYVVALGTVIFLVSLAQIVAAKVKKKGLVTNGLYRVVRHPQHLGIAILTFGLSMWNEIGLRVGDLIAWTLIVFSYILLAEREEEMLLVEYGDDYMKYKKKVPFLLPLLPSMYGRLPKIFPSKGWRRRLILIELYIVFLAILVMILSRIPTEHLR